MTELEKARQLLNEKLRPGNISDMLWTGWHMKSDPKTKPERPGT